MQAVKFQFCHSIRKKMAPNLNRALILRHPLYIFNMLGAVRSTVYLKIKSFLGHFRKTRKRASRSQPKRWSPEKEFSGIDGVEANIAQDPGVFRRGKWDHEVVLLGFYVN